MMRTTSGIALLLAGSWGLIAPQANLGLPELRWISHYAFPGETLIGVFLLAVAYFLLWAKRETHG
jgi:hypothetical protein